MSKYVSVDNFDNFEDTSNAFSGSTREVSVQRTIPEQNAAYRKWYRETFDDEPDENECPRQVPMGRLEKKELYRLWKGMLSRCHNEKSASYWNYGARGIEVCEEWRENFESFAMHMGARPSEKYSIDRINVNRGYQPSNVRWATAVEQANNKQKTVYLTARGVTLTLREWAKDSKVSTSAIRARMRAGMSPEVCLAGIGIDRAIAYGTLK